MINVAELNSLTNLDDYNCGGFALGIPDWYDPNSYNAEQDNFDDMLEDCANDIQRDFPELTRVSDYDGIPNDLDVIGFRLAICNGTEDAEDFHFVLRNDGEWFHKPGSKPIELVDFDIDDEWPRDDCNYNSDIMWFVRPHVNIEPNDFCFFKADKEEDE